ncbi:carotenoid biosynthesis protein [Neolewinella antarctica]|uniref:Membrane protein n=1 Tax=Neolewinella antarctica TaxID=442734 RepID=A0ABX0XDK6_9BACT|nr:carotenoid biosynthesis protein [Neolewinella antarctica]NJC27386.1 putative membrane protein [Neolewinella antarctica]
MLPAVLPITRYTTDGLLLVLNGVLLYTIYVRNRDDALLWWLVVAYVFTFATEAIGVATGAIFGEYAYGPTMWAQWLDVPFVIALNWCALTLACNELAVRIFGDPAKNNKSFLLRSVIVSLVAGTLTALYDVVIEPVAIKLDYWNWAAVDIPLQNYFAWALVAFMISLPLHLLKIRFRSPLLLIYFFAQLFFFVVLNILL